MSEEKCFCHLNGYKVKDADAREKITAIENDLDTLENNVTTNSANIVELESDLKGRILGVEEDLHEVDVRVASLENNDVGGAIALLQRKDVELQQNIEGIAGSQGTMINDLKTRVTIVENQSTSSVGNIADLQQRVNTQDNRILALETRGGLTLYKHIVSVTPDPNPDMGAPTWKHTIISTRNTEYSSHAEIYDDWKNGIIFRMEEGQSMSPVISITANSYMVLLGNAIDTNTTSAVAYFLGDEITAI